MHPRELRPADMTLAVQLDDVAAKGHLGRRIAANLELPMADREFLRLVHAERADEPLTYRDLIERASTWQGYFIDAGLKPKDRVIIVLRHSAELYAAYIGALLGGMVPAMFSFPSAKLSEGEYFRTVGTLIERTSARMIVCFAELAGKMAEHVPVGGRTLIVTPQDVVTSPHRPPIVDCAAAEVAFLQFSSGTTGIKKGVSVSHAALMGHVEAYAHAIRLGPQDRIVSWLPLYHDMGLITCFLMPLITMVPVVAMCPFEWVRRPAMWLQAVSCHRATLAWLPNFAFSFMARTVSAHELEGIDLSSLRGLVNCSEPLMAESLESFAERFSPLGFDRKSFAASYAMAENTFAVTSGGFGEPITVDWIDGDVFRRETSCQPVAASSPGAVAMVGSGRPLPDTAVTIIDAGGKPLPDRRIGEIVVRSPALMNEYDNNRGATAEALRDGALHTGDLGYMADGELFVTGRKKDLIIVGGRNIYPQDIEAAIARVDGIIPGRVVACGRHDPRLGTESLVILAETEVTDLGKCAAIEQAIRETAIMLTDSVAGDVYLAAPRWLLKSSSGKLARQANLERYQQLARGDAAVGKIAGRAAVEPDELLRIVRECVRRVAAARRGGHALRFDDTTSLSRSGLIDSFGLAELLVALESALGRPISDAIVAGFDSIDAIVRALSNGEPQKLQAFDYQQPVPMLAEARIEAQRAGNFWTLLYRLLFRLRGIEVGQGLRVLGPLILEWPGNPQNISIGRNVTLMPGVHFKVRENGAIMIHDEVKLDTGVRLVAANDARIEIGAGSGVGIGTVVNAGEDVLVGRGSLIAGYCTLNASDHGAEAGVPMRQQRFVHAPIRIFDDVWLGTHVTVTRGARIGPGAIVSAGSVVSGDLPPNAVTQGQPARVIKFRT
jgi:fatty-acyl-CoA synthase